MRRKVLVAATSAKLLMRDERFVSVRSEMPECDREVGG